MTTTSSMTGNLPGHSPDRITSGLVEDRLKKTPTVRQQVDQAASTLIVRLPKLPEHKNEDATPEQEITSVRLLKLLEVLKDHFNTEVSEEDE